MATECMFLRQPGSDVLHAVGHTLTLKDIVVEAILRTSINAFLQPQAMSVEAGSSLVLHNVTYLTTSTGFEAVRKFAVNKLPVKDFVVSLPSGFPPVQDSLLSVVHILSIYGLWYSSLSPLPIKHLFHKFVESDPVKEVFSLHSCFFIANVHICNLFSVLSIFWQLQYTVVRKQSLSKAMQAGFFIQFGEI